MNQPHKAQAKEEALQTAMDAVEQRLKSAGMAGPAPGFAQRWQQRLELHRAQEARRQARIMLSVNLSLSVVLLMLIGSQALPMFDSITSVFLGVVEWLSGVVIFFELLASVWGSLSRTLSGVVPTSWWITIGATFFGLVLWWGASLRRYTKQQERA